MVVKLIEDNIKKIYSEIDTLENSLIQNENKAIELRKSFEKLLKLVLGYEQSNTKETFIIYNMFAIISEKI